MRRYGKKALWLFAGWMAASGVARAGRTVRYTAEYYRAFAHKYLDRNIRLYVAYLWVPERNSRIVINGSARIYSDSSSLKLPGYRTFEAYTAYRGRSGGRITVAVAEDEVDRFVRRLGTQAEYDRSGIRSALVKGVLKRTESGHYYVVVGKPRETDGTGRDKGGSDSLFPSNRKSTREYPRISNGRLFTGEKGVPVDDVVRLLRKKHYVR